MTTFVSLQAAIAAYVKRGYRVASQTDTSAQLVRPKHFSFPIFLVLLILLVAPAVLYVLFYVGKRDATVFITVGADGEVKCDE